MQRMQTRVSDGCRHGCDEDRVSVSISPAAPAYDQGQVGRTLAALRAGTCTDPIARQPAQSNSRARHLKRNGHWFVGRSEPPGLAARPVSGSGRGAGRRHGTRSRAAGRHIQYLLRARKSACRGHCIRGCELSNHCRNASGWWPTIVLRTNVPRDWHD